MFNFHISSETPVSICGRRVCFNPLFLIYTKYIHFSCLKSTTEYHGIRLMKKNFWLLYEIRFLFWSYFCACVDMYWECACTLYAYWGRLYLFQRAFILMAQAKQIMIKHVKVCSKAVPTPPPLQSLPAINF